MLSPLPVTTVESSTEAPSEVYEVPVTAPPVERDDASAPVDCAAS